MIKIAKLLLPIDFPSPSFDVVCQASFLARHFNAEIVLLRVSSVTDPDRELADWELLAHEPTLAESFDGLAVRRISRSGDPAQTILDVARDERADLIMMAPHGYEAFDRFHLGSVAATVLHRGECPTWTSAHVEEPGAGHFALRHVLCAVDFGPNDPTTMATAAQLATAFGARLTLAHVTPSVEMYGPGGTHVSPVWEKALVGAARTRLTELRDELGAKAEVFIGSGDVPKTLSRAAKELAVDLLVIGCRRSAGAWRTIAYGILCQSRVPVLCV